MNNKHIQYIKLYKKGLSTNKKRTKHFAKYGWKSYIFIMDKLDEKEILGVLRPETQSGYG